jgi:hypothetical protein
MHTTALSYLHAGLSVVPAHPTAKRPTLNSWREYQERLPTEPELAAWFADAHALGIIAGKVSGNLEMIDFDCAGEAWDAWCGIVAERAPGLLHRLVVETTPSGGRHVVYQCQAPISGNLKLASRRVWCESGDSIVVYGKTYRPRQHGDRWCVDLCLIETRGEGGFFLCDPSPGYKLERGRLDDLATITENERITLLECAVALDQIPREPETANTPAPSHFASAVSGELRPGDDFNARGDVREVLQRHGWTYVRTAGENEQWRRPGKTTDTSATLHTASDRTFYVFSSNAPPFEPNRGYSPFAVYAMLEHGGNFDAAAMALSDEGYGHEPDYGVDLSMWGVAREPAAPAPPAPDFPEHLLNVPGFIGDVIAHNLATAHRPQPVLALAGAIALQGVLAARKVRDARGNRTNLYVVGVAQSGSGKDHARHVNKEILAAAGCTELEGGEEIASAAGLAASVSDNPAIVFQIDELGRFLKNSGDQSRNPHVYEIVSSMMKLYSASRGLWRGKVYSDAKRNREVDQPCVLLHGTTTPETFLGSLTSEGLADGFIGRLLVFEAPSTKPPRLKSAHVPPPRHVVDAARWWTAADGGGYPTALASAHPQPRLVVTTPEAEAIFDELVAIADAEQARPEVAGGSVWARAEEKAIRLALIYAASACRQEPVIDANAARWAADLVLHLTRRILTLAEDWIAEGTFGKRQAEVLRVIKRAGVINKRELIRSTRGMSIRERDEVLANLVEGGLVSFERHASGGRPACVYQYVHRV